MDLQIGDIVFGENENEKFKIISPIGNGFFGIVYEIHDEKGNKYAVKTINTTFLDNNSLRALINEGKLAVGIKNENVLQVFHFHDGTRYLNLPPYMIMEYAEGGTLEEYINEKRGLDEFLSQDEIYYLFFQLTKGMKAINERIVHRDIKPDNILFIKGVPKIADFGLSKVVGAATRASTFKGINHIKYCAPEAWRLEANTSAMDMYSMGIVFYEIATLAYPYHVSTTGDIVEAWKNAHLVEVPQNPRTINPALDNSISQIIIKMIEKQPERRYSSWDEIINRLSNPENELGIDLSEGVSSLVQIAMERRRKEERERLIVEQEQKRKAEYEAIIGYCFKEIKSAVEKIIVQFNQSSDFAKFELSQNSLFSFDIHQENRPGKERIVVSIVPLFQDFSIDGKKIKAWGLAKAPSGLGFNLLLISKSPNDLYGEWHTLHVGHSAIYRNKDNRKAPFPFELKELPKEIQLLNAMHIYQTSYRTFSPDFFVPLLEELL